MGGFIARLKVLIGIIPIVRLDNWAAARLVAANRQINNIVIKFLGQSKLKY